MLKGCEAVGVFYGDYLRREPEQGRAEFQRLLSWFASGRLIVPIDRIYRLHEAAIALRNLADRKLVGKAVLVP